MSTATLQRTSPETHLHASCPTRTVVAVVVEWRGRIALFKRSRFVGHERGLWHCVTGYLEPAVSPMQQALIELKEEAGLELQDLDSFTVGNQLEIHDHAGNPWLIHTYTAVSRRRRLKINNEHDNYRWVAPDKIRRFSNRVPWLDTVLQGRMPNREVNGGPATQNMSHPH